MDCVDGVAVATGAGLITIGKVAVAAAQPPLAAMVLVTVYEPGVLADRSIWPVLTFTNTSPAGVAENVPALAPEPNAGLGLAPFLQNGDPE